jgi:hypothetical protein
MSRMRPRSGAAHGSGTNGIESRVQHRVVLRDAAGPVDARIAAVYIAPRLRPGVLSTVRNPMRVLPGDGG